MHLLETLLYHSSHLLEALRNPALAGWLGLKAASFEQTPPRKLAGFSSSSSGSIRQPSSSIGGQSQRCFPLVLNLLAGEFLSFPVPFQICLSMASSGYEKFSNLFSPCKSLHAGLVIVEYESNDEVLDEPYEKLGEKFGENVDDDEDGDELLPNP